MECGWAQAAGRQPFGSSRGHTSLVRGGEEQSEVETGITTQVLGPHKSLGRVNVARGIKLREKEGKVETGVEGRSGMRLGSSGCLATCREQS